MALTTLLLVLTAAASLAYYLTTSSQRQVPKGTHLPQGPPGKPFVGNLLEIPQKHSWLQFKAWSDRYGPVMRLNIAGNEHYILSTEKAANDLLRERGNIYSSRDQLPAAAQLLSDNLRPLFLPYNDTWRNGRKLMHHVTNVNVANSYQPTQILESTRMLRDLIRDPTRYEHWFERYSAGIIFGLGFGKVIETGDEDIVQEILQVVHTVERVASPGAYLVDTFPALMSLPRLISPFRQELEGLHQRELNLFRRLMSDVREDMKQGKAPKCWERDFIEQQSEFGLTDDQGAYVVGTLFEAGAGTTAAAMMSWVLAMVHHPEWLRKMQAEIDSVCGSERLPILEDMPQLPTTRAVIKEVLRWRPVTAGGVPHLCIKDDVYEGLFIPAGTNVHANQWAIHRDPALYPDPDTFNPRRWLDSDFPTYREPLTIYPNLQNFSAFGVGRRICPGQNIAERSLNLLTTRVAWACCISKARDKEGVEIEPPWYDYTAGFNVQPEPFTFDLEARDMERVLAMEKEFEQNAARDPLKRR